MRLKKIVIYGFKSFADRVVLEFHSGITGVVGPNGCGKSNIADAFRWVMGEQSAKSLRGSKREDVIFAGASMRKPLNFAEVTLVFTEAAGILPLDYDEVEVTRRLHRSGESEYLINRHPARLKDVQSLLLDSGIGRNAFSIFEQGKIDQVIQLSPLERRAIFEDAAGITKVLMSKKEAHQKLGPTNQNIARVTDIYQEVEKQLTLSEQQAAQAREYHQIKQEQEGIEKGILIAKWEAAQERWQKHEQKSLETQAKLGLLQTDQEAWRSSLEEQKKELIEEEKKFRTQSEELYKIRSAAEIQKKEKESLHQRLEETKKREKDLNEERQELIRKKDELQIEATEHDKQQKHLQEELTVAEKELHAKAEGIQKLEAELNKLREHNLKAQQERLKHLHIENQAESDLKQTKLHLSHHGERQNQLKTRISALVQSLEDLQKTQNEKKQQLEQSQQLLETIKMDQRQWQKKLADLDKEIMQAKGEIDLLQKQMVENKARQKVLLKLKEEMEGFSVGSKKLLKEAQNPQSPLFGLIKGLYELLPNIEGKQAAFGVALKNYAQTLVVQTAQDLNKVVAYAKQHKLRDISFLCREFLEKSLSSSFESSPSFLCPEGIEPILTTALSEPLAKYFFKSLFQAKETDKAIEFCQKHPGNEVWVEEGVWIDRLNIIFYPTQGEGNIFIREAELQKLEKEIAEQEKLFMRFEANQHQLKQQKNALYTELNEIDKKIRKEEMTQVELNFGYQKAVADLDKSKQQRIQLEEEEIKLAESIQKLSTSLDEIISRYETASEQAKQSQQHCVNTDVDLEQRMVVFKAKQKELRECDASYQRITGQHQKHVYALNILENRLKENAQQQQKLQNDFEACHKMKQDFTLQIEQLHLSAEEISQQLSIKTTTCLVQEANLEKKRQQVASFEKNGESLRQKGKELENHLYQTGIQMAQSESLKQAIEEEIINKFNIDLREAIECGFKLNISQEQAEKKLRACKQQIEKMGNVNHAAIEEYEQHKERHAFLAKQLEDLTITQNELLKIIQQIETDCRKLFVSTFEAIRSHFIKNFQILFTGGEADLQLTESEEILEAGIEIIAKPPGKQMRSISLLSGGEKCLTAMALLFAIFEVRPAPFCILDEIDAPLDDSNIERFVKVLKQFTEKFQFIVITHNKRTMAVADLLFGVSMEEKGVSKLLSMQFAKEAEASHQVSTVAG